MPDKLSLEFQAGFSNRLIFDQAVFKRIDPSAKLHEHTEHHPLSSSAACLNVIGGYSEARRARFRNHLGQHSEINPVAIPG